jgi:hypothetical protein
MKINVAAVTGAIVVISAIAGCVHAEKQFNVAAADQIMIGRSTKQDVVNLLGQPKSQYHTPATGEMWTYTNLEVDNTDYVMGVVTGGLYYLAPNTKMLSRKTEMLRVYFKDSIVSDCVIIDQGFQGGGSLYGSVETGSKHIERKCGSPATDVPPAATTPAK